MLSESVRVVATAGCQALLRQYCVIGSKHRCVTALDTLGIGLRQIAIVGALTSNVNIGCLRSSRVGDASDAAAFTVAAAAFAAGATTAAVGGGDDNVVGRVVANIVVVAVAAAAAAAAAAASAVAAAGVVVLLLVDVVDVVAVVAAAAAVVVPALGGAGGGLCALNKLCRILRVVGGLSAAVIMHAAVVMRAAGRGCPGPVLSAAVRIRAAKLCAGADGAL